MSILLESVRVPQVAQLADLVGLARSTPTGAGVMRGLERAVTNVELFTAAEWLDDASRAGVAARFDRLHNRFLLPIEPLPGAAAGVDPAERLAISLVHEGEHRLQGRPGAPFVLRRLLVEPWQLLLAERRAPGGALRRAVRDEVDAHLLDRQFGAELAGVRGRVPADVPTREALEAEILAEPGYAWQARRQVGGAKALRTVHVVGGGVLAAGTGAALLAARD
jgi:hypothetical protein